MKSQLLLITLLLALLNSGCGKEEKVTIEKNISVDESKLQGVVRTNLDSPEPTKAQLERKAKNTARVKELGLPFIEHLPVIEDEKQIKAREPKEVAKRGLAIMVCALKGETQAKEEAFSKDLVKKLGVEPFFSPQEKAFIDNPKPKRQDIINFCWEYECLHVLLWALGHIKELTPPNAVCNVAEDVGIIKNLGPEKFISNAKLRSQAEILDMADYYYRLHWAAIELRLKGKKSDKINEGIIRERHRALNWLIRYMNQEWDDVTTDT